jgi:predicted small integral membrane protein
MDPPSDAVPPPGTNLQRLHNELTDPTLLVLPLVAAAFCLLRWLHLIADEPYWVYVTIIVGAGLFRLAYSVLGGQSERAWP